MSKQIGSFWNSKEKKFNLTLQSTLPNIEHTPSLRDSGFSNNLVPTKMNCAWLHPSFNSDMKRTEYRIQYNRKKNIHFVEPMFSSGILRKKETNYKHT